MRSNIVAPADSLRSAGSSCDSLCWPPAPLDMLAAAAAHPQLVRTLDEASSSTADSGQGPEEGAVSSPPAPTARPRSSTPFAQEKGAQQEPGTPPCLRSTPLQCPGAPRCRPGSLRMLPTAALPTLRPPPLIVGDVAAALAAAGVGELCSSPARSSRTHFAAAAAAGGDGSSGGIRLPPPAFLAVPSHQQQDKWDKQAAHAADACLVPLLASALQQTTLLSVSCHGPGPLPGQTPAFDWRRGGSRDAGEAADLSAAAAGLLGLEAAAWRLPTVEQGYEPQQSLTSSSCCPAGEGGDSSAAPITLGGSSSSSRVLERAAAAAKQAAHLEQQQKGMGHPTAGMVPTYGDATTSSSMRGVHSSLRVTLPAGPSSVRRPLIDSLTRSGLDTLAGAGTCLTPVAAAAAIAVGRPDSVHCTISSAGKPAPVEVGTAAAAAAPAAWLDLLEQRLAVRDAAAAAAAGGAGKTPTSAAAAAASLGGMAASSSHKRAHSPGGAAPKRQHCLQQQLVGLDGATASPLQAGGPPAPPAPSKQLLLLPPPPFAGAAAAAEAVCLPGGRALPPPGLVALRMLGYDPLL